MSQSISAKSTPHVTRSVVPQKASYNDYKQELRVDFFFSCAYCNMTESEATAVRFTIDHYEPQGARPDLTNDYNNLMYACDSCNIRKGNRLPPKEAIADGFRFYRPDGDVFDEHFRLKDIRVQHLTNTGDFTIEALDLNRLELRRLRELRKRLYDCGSFISQGVHALSRVKIDQLPPHVKGKADSAIKKAIESIDKAEADIDEILRGFAESPLAGTDHESDDRLKQRQKRMKEMQALYPGAWRAPRN